MINNENQIYNVVEKIVIDRNKWFNDAVLGEIEKIGEDNCIFTKVHLNEKEIVKALTEYIEKQNSKTNYDRIKSMSVEEMAVNLAKIQCDAIEQTVPIKVTEEARKEQYELCIQWLLQEVSEDE